MAAATNAPTHKLKAIPRNRRELALAEASASMTRDDADSARGMRRLKAEERHRSPTEPPP